MPRSQVLRTIALTLSNLLLPIAVLAFASGFFPYKPVLPDLASFGDLPKNEEWTVEGQPEAPFDRVVFMVVDALRSDFVYGEGSGMEFTQGLISSGAAIPFTAHATPPTVTMPRVKALTTGSVPSFLDLILNFAESDTSSSLATQDTWLAQLRGKEYKGRKGKLEDDGKDKLLDGKRGKLENGSRKGKLVFYGDDTWLKLFPGDFFARSDGTSSFFVSDFTEVDNNVTRHVPEELLNDDWNAMIMHYLGLDHIGHKTGPQGPNMLPKQKEMDGIVKMIYEAMEEEDHHQNTLLVLAGDHGMNAGGNHGGSGPGETEPALLFASPKFRQMRESKDYECPTVPKKGTEFHFYTKTEQSDVVPSLAGLMGFPVPKNSLGIPIPELMGFWEREQEIKLLRQNAWQMLKIVEATFGQESFRSKVWKHKKANSSLRGSTCSELPEGEQELACKWALADTRPHTKAALYEFLETAQSALSGTASSYNIPRMVVGIAVAFSSMALAVYAFPSLWPPSGAGTFFTALAGLYGMMMFASSYVEEEQHFWYWLTPAWLTVLTVLRGKDKSTFSIGSLNVSTAALAVPVLALHRIAMRWNQTGQKHSGEPDIVHTFFPNHHLFMWLLVLITYAFTGFRLATTTFRNILPDEFIAIASVLLTVPAVIFKLNFTQADAPELVQGLAEKIREVSEPFDLVLQARLVFVVLAVCTVILVVLAVGFARLRVTAGIDMQTANITIPERLHPLLTLFLMTQTRAPNVPLFLALELQRACLRRLLFTPSPQAVHQYTIKQWQSRALETALTSLLLSQTAYFCFGGSNSISSIDLSNAYNGVVDYNIVAVGILLFASNWTGPVWWCSAAVTLLLPKTNTDEQIAKQKQKPAVDGARSWVENERAKLHADAVAAVSKPLIQQLDASGEAGRDSWFVYVTLMTVFISSSLVAVMVACTALRTHLFIWTVFSPKYLYAMAWSVGWHLIINVGFGSVMWSLRIMA